MTEENNKIEEKVSLEGLNLLLDSSYPLLKKFREVCPGTYKHSQAVASMIEGIALALDLDVNRLKVAAVYHDIGKSYRPKMFSENQSVDENPHDKLDPEISYDIITRHVSDSVVILINVPEFPRDIIEIISQHHGTSVLKYFYNKSKTGKEKNFRYKTINPQTIEAAILMICDQIEAKSKAQIQANKFDPNMLIEETINDLLNEGSLDNVTMRLGDLKKIKIALGKELEGTFTKRVEYDEVEKKKTIKEEITKDIVEEQDG